MNHFKGKQFQQDVIIVESLSSYNLSYCLFKKFLIVKTDSLYTIYRWVRIWQT
ncbi:hypothetical protein K5K98_15160 (plasmid) [Vagococcus fluvialis]|nr:hypothetical protein K5K98_15160 [Vagococcus fluvialis]